MEQLDFRPVLLAWANLQADTMPAKKCAKKGVGGMIHWLRVQLNAGVPGIYGRDALRATQLLESHCRLCGRCAKEQRVAAE